MLLMVAAIFVGMVQGGRAVDPVFVFQVLFAVAFAVFLFARFYRAFASLQYPDYLRMALEPGGYLKALFGRPRESCRAACPSTIRSYLFVLSI